MPESLGDDHSDKIFDRVIIPETIEEVELGGYPAVKVVDTAGNEYTSFKDTFRKELVADRQKYIGQPWEIYFTIYKGQYLSFQGFTQAMDEEDVVEEEIDIDELKKELDGDDITDTDRRITRQSAAHDASRIVQGMLADGKFRKHWEDKDELREEIQEEVEFWTEKFKHHHRTGEWRGESAGE